MIEHSAAGFDAFLFREWILDSEPRMRIQSTLLSRVLYEGLEVSSCNLHWSTRRHRRGSLLRSLGQRFNSKKPLHDLNSKKADSLVPRQSRICNESCIFRSNVFVVLTWSRTYSSFNKQTRKKGTKITPWRGHISYSVSGLYLRRPYCGQDMWRDLNYTLLLVPNPTTLPGERQRWVVGIPMASAVMRKKTNYLPYFVPH